ncbi:uncharacterized protein LOC126904266 isoform X2 [Daktulosphaira vitifoliae]|uniref:uncharacterized protein LOC126904266 isoform X2 n=1 Tax=Daktulosphaira vitifoliae TaxID=58002 RepID=UPI0021AADF0B|nr:uncharacterized protein LOC126904266 isoform X2 [Daktulosphaira vitifoliae]XP_050539115.1 uncharacterized protein LOC126904266 isoform X2 [Daktulosphaira vitifoliae]
MRKKKLFAPTSYESLDSDLSIPLINEEDLTSLYYEKNASANTNSQSNTSVKHITESHTSKKGQLVLVFKYLIADHRFQPVDSEWRKNISRKLDFKTLTPITLINCNKQLKSPKLNNEENVVWRDNKYYKIISYLFSGTYKNYKLLREKVLKAINENENIINLLGGFDKKEKYFKDGKFNTTGMVQIIATSFVIETSIYVYYNNWKKWVYIPKDIFTQDFSKINEEKCIYIFASRDKFFNYSLIEDVCD